MWSEKSSNQALLSVTTGLPSPFMFGIVLSVCPDPDLFHVETAAMTNEQSLLEGSSSMSSGWFMVYLLQYVYLLFNIFIFDR